ncbi:2-succinyl-6-hydroxy-2, 4-cyclohexadiene-1-carboxylate synthase [Sinobacterium norvegicum]|uniref:2-succinyl-6-hydroxy-2, 4-cyclohexadiene-1-carboxylate synthase n=1 Tax=Sinobacterium norvegicum TaxID=1641715 RepID=A0ABN8EDW8_9GAMM|nr:alpha/beta hydrolase [Sinobacterium norvegicum]CAH0990635.1 2-succinyl-6-hydroxy-2, 4-cyclohexadiene-1-carboxylate synthase [Sinobacterium norvegicum]
MPNNDIDSFSTIANLVEEGEFEHCGQNIVYQRWGDGTGRRVIALHGWLDNAASFEIIAPMLHDIDLVVLDQIGHGYSDHRTAPAAYNIWDDLLDVLALADHLEWQGFSLLGHSRGAMISWLLAATQPERIEQLIAIDGLIPLAAKPEDAAQQLANHLNDSRGIATKRIPSYNNLADMIAARCKATGFSAAASVRIVKRGHKRDDDGLYRWRNDPRLMMASAFKLTAQHIESISEAIRCPVFVIIAKQGMGSVDDYLAVFSHIEHVDHVVIDGGHHCHMEEQASEVAALIQKNVV